MGLSVVGARLPGVSNQRQSTGADRVPPGRSGDGEGEADDGSGIETVAASQLHVTDVVLQDGALRRVTSLRLQGAPPQVSVAFAGETGRRAYPPTALVHVLRRRGR